MIRGSVILPAYNAAAYLLAVLPPLLQLGPDWEVLVVDDGSTDTTWDILQSLPVRALRQSGRQGQSQARNLAARQARGEILVFVDGDVVTSVSTVQAMAGFLEENLRWDAVFGCYADSGCPKESSLSRFRNLLHRYVHQCGAGPAGSFWAGLGAMRRSTFERAGGFDRRFDGIEDVELGARLCRSGSEIWLHPGFEGHHLKRWTLASMVRTDLMVRALPWTYYGWLGRTPRCGLNLAPVHALAPLSLAISLLWPQALVLYALANLPTYCFMTRSGGPVLGIASVFYLIVHHLCCLSGALLGTLRYLLDKVGSRRSLSVQDIFSART